MSLFNKSQILKQIFKGKEIPKHPKLKILMGLAGAGKGTIAKKYRLNNKYTVSVNYDELIMENKKYQQELKKIKKSNNDQKILKDESQKLYWKYRKELANIDNEVNKKAINEGYSILWETTGSNIDWIYSYLFNFVKHGYDIHIHYPVVIFDELEKRIQKRELEKGQEGAPIEQLKKDRILIENNILNLIPYAKSVYFYDNTGDKIKKSLNIKDVYDVKCYKNFTKDFGIYLSNTFGTKLKMLLENDKSCKRD